MEKNLKDYKEVKQKMGFLPEIENQSKPIEIDEELQVPIPQEKVDEKEQVEKQPKEVEEKHRVVVVKELPTQIIRQSKSEEGTILHYVTIEEALTEALNK